jgi:hypothetical protein
MAVRNGDTGVGVTFVTGSAGRVAAIADGFLLQVAGEGITM